MLYDAPDSFDKKNYQKTDIQPFFIELQSDIVQSKSHQYNLIQSMVAQNTFFKKHQELMHLQLTKLTYMSSYLLAENKELRRMYHQRTLDISQTISSIKINLDIQYYQKQHLEHLIKESNGILLKKMKGTIKYKQELQQNNKSLSEQYTKIIQPSYEQKESILNEISVHLEDKLNNKTVKTLQETRSQQYRILHQIEVDIDDIIGEIRLLFHQNHQMTKQIIIIQEDNQKQKQICTQEIIKTINKIKFQQNQKKQFQNKVENQQIFINILKQKYQISKNKTKIALINMNKLNLQIDKYNERYYYLKSIKNKYIEIIHKQQQKYNLNQQQYQQIINKVKKSQKNINQLKNNNQYEIQNLENQFNSYLLKIKKQIKQNEIQTMKEIKDIERKKNNVQAEISLKEQQYISLDENISQFKRIIETLQNPIADIEKLQLKLRMDPQRLPLNEILQVN